MKLPMTEIIDTLNTLSIKPMEGRIVIECNPGISHKIITELLGSGIVLLVVLEITIDEESGFLSICYIEPGLNKIVKKVFSEGKNRKSSIKKI